MSLLVLARRLRLPPLPRCSLLSLLVGGSSTKSIGNGELLEEALSAPLLLLLPLVFLLGGPRLFLLVS